MKWLAGCLLVVACVGSAAQEKGWQTVRGNALQALFDDQDLGDGVHYAYQFHRDGTLTGMNMGKPTRGSWKVGGQYLCYRWNGSKSEEECYEVRRRGHEVRMFLDGYEAFSGSLTPIEPQTEKRARP